MFVCMSGGVVVRPDKPIHFLRPAAVLCRCGASGTEAVSAGWARGSGLLSEVYDCAGCHDARACGKSSIISIRADERAYSVDQTFQLQVEGIKLLHRVAGKVKVAWVFVPISPRRAVRVTLLPRSAVQVNQLA